MSLAHGLSSREPGEIWENALEPGRPTSVVTVPLTSQRPGRILAPDARPAAPELAGATAWLNSAPLSLADLRGRVVLVDVWTYGCSNCIRTLPLVRALDERYHER